MRRCLLVTTALVLFHSAVLSQDNWPQFRGGAKAGVGQGKSLPAKWDATENVVWSREVPGRGWSSPIVWGDRVFLTSTVSEKDLGEPQKGLYINNLRGQLRPGEHQWMVTCLDRKTGKPLWSKVARKGKAPGTIHVKNSYASETPVTDGKRLYVYFGNVGVFCYNLDGSLLWSKKLEPVPTRFGWGPASSPALHKDRLFIVNDNEKQSYLLALNAETGKELWRVKRDEKSSWVTPFVWENDKRTEIVTAGTKKVRSYDLDGKLLWELKGMSSITIPTPFAVDGLLYVTSGYVLDSARPVYAIRPGATGDVTLKPNETKSDHVAWSQRLAGPYHPTPVVYDGYLYVLYDRGFLGCYNAKTGEKVYEKQRIGRGASGFTASPWAYDGKIFCLSEDGDTVVVLAGPKFKLLGKNRIQGTSLATPAIAKGSLFVRTLNKLYRLEKKEKP